MSTLQVESREYKLLVNHEPFADPNVAVNGIWDEIEEAAKMLPVMETKGKLDEEETRTILFLDTPDHTLRRHGLVLRRRAVKDAVEFTLKCRSDDRFFAAGTDVKATDGLDDDRKFEEDIAPPFRCRFSHSTTITLTEERKNGPQLKTLGDVTALFPVLGTMRADGLSCARETKLDTVNRIEVDETVWKGGKLVLDQGDKDKSVKASVALILWSRGKASRPVVAELSFRIKEGEETFSRSLAGAARLAYELLQRLDCARRDGMTKTEFIYRDASRD